MPAIEDAAHQPSNGSRRNLWQTKPAMLRIVSTTVGVSVCHVAMVFQPRCLRRLHGLSLCRGLRSAVSRVFLRSCGRLRRVCNYLSKPGILLETHSYFSNAHSERLPGPLGATAFLFGARCWRTVLALRCWLAGMPVLLLCCRCSCYAACLMHGTYMYCAGPRYARYRNNLLSA